MNLIPLTLFERCQELCVLNVFDGVLDDLNLSAVVSD